MQIAMITPDSDYGITVVVLESVCKDGSNEQNFCDV
jgi:hypothetical protein